MESCTNLTDAIWTPLATNTLINGSTYFSESEWTNYPAQFYRFVPQPIIDIVGTWKINGDNTFMFFESGGILTVNQDEGESIWDGTYTVSGAAFNAVISHYNADIDDTVTSTLNGTIAGIELDVNYTDRVGGSIVETGSFVTTKQ